MTLLTHVQRRRHQVRHGKLVCCHGNRMRVSTDDGRHVRCPDLHVRYTSINQELKRCLVAVLCVQKTREENEKTEYTNRCKCSEARTFLQVNMESCKTETFVSAPGQFVSRATVFVFVFVLIKKSGYGDIIIATLQTCNKIEPRHRLTKDVNMS